MNRYFYPALQSTTPNFVWLYFTAWLLGSGLQICPDTFLIPCPIGSLLPCWNSSPSHPGWLSSLTAPSVVVPPHHCAVSPAHFSSSSPRAVLPCVVISGYPVSGCSMGCCLSIRCMWWLVLPLCLLSAPLVFSPRWMNPWRHHPQWADSQMAVHCSNWTSIQLVGSNGFQIEI
jgi:hypothetical protein